MSTRPQRHDGNRERGWEELNTSWGNDDRMESEAWYIAEDLVENGLTEEAEEILVGHFGSIEAAAAAQQSLDDKIAERFEVVVDAVTQIARTSSSALDGQATDPR